MPFIAGEFSSSSRGDPHVPTREMTPPKEVADDRMTTPWYPTFIVFARTVWGKGPTKEVDNRLRTALKMLSAYTAADEDVGSQG